MESTTSVLSLLERVTHAQWIGVEFLEHMPTGRDGVHSGAVRFCEAVCRTGHGSIELSPEMICCDGAKRAFAWAKDKDEALALHLSEKTGMNRDRAQELVRKVPVMGHAHAGIRVGQCANPDVLVTYTRPEAAMRLVRLWEVTTGQSLHVDISSIMGVCGNAVVKARMSQSISISFGCPDSRQYGGIKPEEMVIAVPARMRRNQGVDWLELADESV